MKNRNYQLVIGVLVILLAVCAVLLVQMGLKQKEKEPIVEAYLPERIYVAAGRTIELYNDQVVWTGQRDNYQICWTCEIGRNLEDKFSVTGTEDKIGEYPLNLSVYDYNLNKVIDKNATLVLVDDTLEESYTILNIGDSLSNSTPWYEEVYNLSGEKITYVGTRGEGNFKHEARAGFSSGDYIDSIEYVYEGEGIQPFYCEATGTFDWQYYKDTTGIDPDIVQIFLGINGMDIDPYYNRKFITQMVDNIRSYDKDIPIYVVNTIYVGDQNGIGYQENKHGYAVFPGAWKLYEDRENFNLMTALSEAFQDYENLYLIPAALTHDSAHNFASEELAVNPRSSQTEDMLVESIHPNEAGYLQIADCMFSVYCGTLK